MDETLVGREHDVERLGDFLAGIPSVGGALLLLGEPGVGKTALLAEMSRRGVAAGMRVLQSAGVQYRAQVGYGALRQLLTVLRVEPLWVELFTGLRVERFDRLVRAVWHRGGEGPRTGRPWCLPLEERVLLVAVYYRTNLTMRQLAPLFGISTATVCRVVQRLGPLLALEPAPRPQPGVERLWIVDGTLIPVRDRTVGASSRNYRFSANVQVVIDADTRLVVATARPAPGNKGRPRLAGLRPSRAVCRHHHPR
ncbi:hypothetical protein GCM10010440_35950 [Kitasatospora cinereorecta]